jgi:hypothetical protein
MAHYATLNEYRFDRDANDIRGARLYGEGGLELGHVCDVVFDHATGDIPYMVLAYGNERRVLLPLDRLSQSTTEEESFSSNLTFADLDHLPAFDDKVLKNDRQWRTYEKLHRSCMGERRRVPRESFGEEMSIEGRREDDYLPDVWPMWHAPVFGTARYEDERIKAIAQVRRSSAEDSPTARPGPQLGSKWNAFAEHLKRDLHRIRGACPRCEEQDARAA